MKKLFLSLLFLFSATLYAQTPNAFNYQAVARGNSGSALPSQTISVEFTIHDASTGGTVLYQETQSLTTNQFGLFSCQIGTGTVVSGTFSTIDWAGNLKFLQVGFDPAGGNSFTDMGTTQLISVPYAKVADVALNEPWAASGNNIINTNSGHVYIGGTPSLDAGLVVRGNGIFNSAIGIEDANTNTHWSMEVDGNDFGITKGSGSTFTPFVLQSTGNGGFLNTANDTSLWVSNSGKVGIGIGIPANLLQLNAPNTYADIQFTSDSTGTAAYHGFVVGTNTNAGDALVWNFSNQPIKFGTDGTERLRIGAAGSIGIGTTTPTGQLSVVNNGSGLGAPSIYTSNTNAAGIGIYVTTNSTDATSVFTNSAGSVGGTSATMAKFFDGGASDLVRIDNNAGGSEGRISLWGENSGNNYGGYIYGFDYLSTGGLSFGTMNGSTYTEYLALYHPTSGTSALTPGNDNTTSCGTSSYRWTAVYAANGTIQTSDERLKENVQPISYGLNALMNLHPVSYQWKDEHVRIGNGNNLGFLAQDLEKVLPDVVVHTKISQEEVDNAKKYRGKDITDTDAYGVKYSEIIPVLVKAIQEQQAEIEALKLQVNSQQK